jgi:hypothetical protein
MSSIATALTVLACLLAGVLSGFFLRKVLPDHHIRDDSREVVKVGTGLIATLTALVLGLLISSAKSSYDAVNLGLTQSGAKVIALDRMLAQYGSETKEARHLLRRLLASVIRRAWPEEKFEYAELQPTEAVTGMEGLQHMLRTLAPSNDEQRALQSQALQVCNDSTMTRWQIIEQAEIGLPTPFLVVLVSWLTILFASFGLFAPRNATVFVVLFLCALSAAGAIFLLLEMSHPMSGIIKVSSAPLLKALEFVGK